MSAVQIRLNLSDLSREMGAMRIWLDQHRFEPSSFSCRDGGDGVVVSVEFKAADQAQAFSKHFNGRVNRRLRRKTGDASPLDNLDNGWSQSGVIG
jgi:hypothetical protein